MKMIYLVWTITGLCLLLFIYYILPILLCRIWVRLSSYDFTLTYDDGPGKTNTNEILNLLSKYNAKAAFFLLGRRIVGNEKEVKRILDEGHCICSHGYEHINYWEVSPWRAIKDVKKGWDMINAALGASDQVYPFRPPYGKLTIVVFLFLLFKGSSIIYWTFDGGDTWRDLPDASKHSAGCRKKDVILLHDFDREDINRNKYVTDFTEYILKSEKLLASSKKLPVKGC